MSELSVQPIGYVESCFKEKFGTPRQANLAKSAAGRIRMVAPFDDESAFDGVQAVSHLWLHFLFDQNRDSRWRPKVRPPRLGGNSSLGVFATRSPYRPNRIGLSVVRLLGIERTEDGLYVNYQGGDLIEGTPILDIKPYVPYADCLPEAFNDLAPAPPEVKEVRFEDGVAEACEQAGGIQLVELVREVLSLDPRPQFHQDETREYGVTIEKWNIRWKVLSEGSVDAYILVLGIGLEAPNCRE